MRVLKVPKATQMLTVYEAVDHPVTRIGAGIYGENALQFVVAGLMQHIARSQDACHPAAEKGRLADCSMVTKWPCKGVHFLTTLSQIMVSDAKIQGLEKRMTSEQCLVRLVPELVRGSSQVLSLASSRNKG